MLTIRSIETFPAATARIISSPDLPKASLATALSLIPAVSSNFKIRFFSVVWLCTSMRR